MKRCRRVSILVNLAAIAAIMTVPAVVSGQAYEDVSAVSGDAPQTPDPTVKVEMWDMPRAVLWDNGPLVNSPGTGVGGADESVLQSVSLGMSTLGFGGQFLNNNSMADDFAIADAGGWDVNQITFFAYQTNGGVPSTITGVYVRIWDGDPSAGGSVIWGDLTTNRLLSTAWTNIYRVSETTTGTNTSRAIMANVADIGGLHLAQGTYWVEFQTDGSAASGPWIPPITVTGQTTTGNAQQALAGAWQPALDTGTATQQGVPFVVEGTVVQLLPDIDVSPLSLASTQPADTVASVAMNIGNLGGSDLTWAIAEDLLTTAKLADWFDDFDAYATGSQMHGQGGWKGYNNDPTYGALTSSVQARSAPNSVDIVGNSDLVHEYAESDGIWIYTAWQFIPDGFTGESYFILLNQYDDAGVTNNWSTQVHFNAASNTVIADGVGAGATLPLILNTWVEINVLIDLVADTQAFYYGNQLLYQGSWSDGVSGGGITSIGAVDLFANGASSVYYDDMSLVEQTVVCAAPSDIPWLSLNPTAGTTPGGGSTPVDVSFDSTGLAVGTYIANLCVTSNDPDPGPGNGTDLVVVPVQLDVEEGSPSYCSAPMVPIPDNDPVGVADQMVMMSGGVTIADLDVYVDAPHTWSGDLIFNLLHDDTGTNVTFIDRPGVPASTFGCSTDNYLVTVNDEGPDGCIEAQCAATAPAITGDAPGGDPCDTNLLAAFDGESLDGTWTLTVSDSAGGDTGTLNEWCLNITGVPPVSSISLVKTVGTTPGVCAPTSAIDVVAGTTVYYCYEVTNTGEVTLDLHDLVDDVLGTIFTGFAYSLAPGASVDTVAAGLTVSTVINSTTTNTGTWTAYNQGPANTAQATAEATVTVVEPPNIDVDPLSIGSTQAPDTSVQVFLDVANTGELDLDWTIDEEPVTDLPTGPQPTIDPVDPATALEWERTGLDDLPPTAPATRNPAAAARARRMLLATGLLLIPDSSNDRVMAFDPITGNLVDADFIPTDATNLSTPKSAILSADGTSVLVSDQLEDVVQQYDLDGNYIGLFAPAGGGNTAILDNILGIDLRPNGNLLVPVDAGANQDSVAEFDTGGNYLGNFIAIGAGGLDGGFDVYPLGTDWLVTSINSDNVLRFDASGAPVGVFAPGVAFGEQIAGAASGNILVANFSTPNTGVMEFTPAGALVGVYTGVTGNRGVYELPNGNILTTNGSGVHEIDRLGNLVETKYSVAGAQYIEYVEPLINCASPADVPWLSETPSNGTTAGGASTPVQVTLDSTGLGSGTYTANLCVVSNDPDAGPGNGTDLVVVPVEMTVEGGEEVDWGDAPDPTYPTLAASNGARHTISALALIALGSQIDGEPDGQPSALADGDDLNNLDDEDGVTFTSPIEPGMNATVDVVATVPLLLSAWMDFNGDGDWNDAGEQIFTDQPLAAGLNNLVFAVPVGAIPFADIHARFRASTQGGLGVDGPAPDGEVEDYLVTTVPVKLQSFTIE